MNRRSVLTVAVSVLAGILTCFPAGGRAAGDPAKGAELATTCMGCHGIAGYRNAYPSYRVPKLGGQKPAYLVAALKAYKAGERDFGTMRAIAADLTDKDMEDIAAYYGAQPVTTAEKKP